MTVQDRHPVATPTETPVLKRRRGRAAVYRTGVPQASRARFLGVRRVRFQTPKRLLDAARVRENLSAQLGTEGLSESKARELAPLPPANTWAANRVLSGLFGSPQARAGAREGGSENSRNSPLAGRPKPRRTARNRVAPPPPPVPRGGEESHVIPSYPVTGGTPDGVVEAWLILAFPGSRHG